MILLFRPYIMDYGFLKVLIFWHYQLVGHKLNPENYPLLCKIKICSRARVVIGCQFRILLVFL
nr:MAG TPA: hypothetical protein [Bacteriophage sp.]